MREILFRGKQIDTGAWVEGAFCMKDCDDPFGELVDRPSIIKYEEPHSGYWFRVDPETVGQFTGLTDNNGTKVFEGDIIAFTCTDGTKHFSVVKYGAFNCSCCDGVYGWYLYGDCGDIRDLDPKGGMLRFISVEGNIHDNPELMENK